MRSNDTPDEYHIWYSADAGMTDMKASNEFLEACLYRNSCLRFLKQLWRPISVASPIRQTNIFKSYVRIYIIRNYTYDPCIIIFILELSE